MTTLPGRAQYPSVLALHHRLEQPAEFDVAGLGEASLDEVWLVPQAPRPGTKLACRQRLTLGGGQVATALVACSRLGLRATFIGAVGDDSDGQDILAGLEVEEVSTRDARIVRGGRSRRAAIFVEPEGGQRTIVFDEDERTLAELAEITPLAAAAGRVLLVDGTNPAAALAAARAAHARGRVVACDLDRVGQGTAELLHEVDVCLVAEGFPQALSGEGEVERALEHLRALGPSIACVTLGREGAVALGDQGFVRVPAARPTRVVDSTACGDTFRAGFLAALLEGRDLAGCLGFAAAAAAIKLRDFGRSGCPTHAEVDALLAQDGGHRE